MKKKIGLILFTIPLFHALANQAELVDIKPIYRSYNYQMIVPLSVCAVLVLIFLIYKLVKKIDKHRKNIEVPYDWNLLITEIGKDANLSPKQVESELVRVMKLFLDEKFNKNFSSKSDSELLQSIENEHGFTDNQKNKLKGFIDGSTHFRFADLSIQDEISRQRVQALKEIIDVFEGSVGGVS